MLSLQSFKRNSLLVNISSLGLVQMAIYVIPILILPFITRALGPEYFGKACYAQTIVAYFTLFVNYGFEYSATQEVALHKGDHDNLQLIFSQVLCFKSLLLLLSFVVLAVLYCIMPKVHADGLSFFFAALINVGFVLFPTWFFQGQEKMALMSIFAFTIKFLGALLTVLLVSLPSDYLFYLLSLSFAQIVAGGVAFVYVVRHYHLSPVFPQHLFSSPSVSKGFPIFLNVFFSNCNTLIGVTLMGFYSTAAEVGIFSGAQKMIIAIMMITSNSITISLFPRMSRRFMDSRTVGMAYMRKCLLYIAIFSAAVSVVTYIVGPFAVSILFGKQFAQSAVVLRYLSVLPFFVAMANTLTVQGLYGMQLQRFAPIVGLLVCLSSLGLNFWLLPIYGVAGVCIAWIVCSLVEILIDVLLISLAKS